MLSATPAASIPVRGDEEELESSEESVATASLPSPRRDDRNKRRKLEGSNFVDDLVPCDEGQESPQVAEFGPRTESSLDPQMLSKLLQGMHFQHIELDECICDLYQVVSTYKEDVIEVASKLGENLGATPNCKTLSLLFISIAMMWKYEESRDLVSVGSSVFKSFSSERGAIITCVMQGGKTRRAIFFRGLLVFVNGQKQSYFQMERAVQELNEDYRELISDPLHLDHRYNKWCHASSLIFGSDLNKKEHLGEIQHLGNRVHFNFRLFSSRNIAILSSAE